MTMKTETKPVTPDRIMQFAWGYAPMLVIDAAVHHGVFDRLQPGARSLEELARETGASVRGLKAILNALVGLGLLKRDADRYALTPESEAFLVSSQPEYRGLFFRHHRSQLLPQWMHLTEVVRTGQPWRDPNHEGRTEDYFAGFVESLFPVSFAAAHALGEHLGVAKSTAAVSVLDIGAGSGVWGIALALQSPHVRVHAVDLPVVLEITRKVAEGHGVAARMTTAAGDYFEANFGQGHQVATLGHILHGEGPDRIRHLLRKTHEALAPGGVVAIQEFVPDDDRTGPAQALLFAVNMLVNTESGDTYTFAEMGAWLREAGFVKPRRLEVPAVSPLVLADKPPV
jgi:2-polyprenyl-3-methyl-5-hydroxy-6-metoxy-1,4-benzoquinol methylase